MNNFTIRPWEEDAGTTGENVKAQVGGRGCDESQLNPLKRAVRTGGKMHSRFPDERPLARRMRYDAVITIKAVSKAFHI